MDLKDKKAWRSERQTSEYEIESAANTNDFDIDDISDFDDVQPRACKRCGVIEQISNPIICEYKANGFENYDFVCCLCARCVGIGAK